MSTVLESLSNELAAVVVAAGASIVRVEGRRRQAASGVIWSEDGIIITAHHVVERDENIGVGLPDGSRLPAQLVGRDPSTDLAVLRVGTNGLTPAKWAAGDTLRVGHLVLAAGRPEEQVQATLGVISALEGEWRTRAGGAIDAYVQTDVVMYPGFSGGPLVSAASEFAGINSSALLRGLSITIPAATIQRVAGALLAHGKITRGFLGVSAQPVRLPAAIAAQMAQETGLLLVAVEGDSPAERGGLLLGDTLLSVDDAPVRHMDDLLAVLGSDRIGRAVPVRVLRGGQVQTLQVTIGARA